MADQVEDARDAYFRERINPVLSELFDSWVIVGVHRPVGGKDDGQEQRLVSSQIKPADRASLHNVHIVGRVWVRGLIE
jgi:hypothetical protein